MIRIACCAGHVVSCEPRQPNKLRRGSLARLSCRSAVAPGVHTKAAFGSLSLFDDRIRFRSASPIPPLPSWISSLPCSKLLRFPYRTIVISTASHCWRTSNQLARNCWTATNSSRIVPHYRHNPAPYAGWTVAGNKYALRSNRQTIRSHDNARRAATMVSSGTGSARNGTIRKTEPCDRLEEIAMSQILTAA